MSDLLKMTPAQFCLATDACAEGRDWAITQPTMSDVWEKCQRPDWLLWVLNRLDQRPDDRTLVSFAVWCVRNTPLVNGHVTGDLLTDPRLLATLEVAERFAKGRATTEEVDAARVAAGGVTWASERAIAWAAARAAERGAERPVSWATVRAAEWAAVRHAAHDAAWVVAEAAQADHIRTLVPNPFSKEVRP